MKIFGITIFRSNKKKAALKIDPANLLDFNASQLQAHIAQLPTGNFFNERVTFEMIRRGKFVQYGRVYFPYHYYGVRAGDTINLKTVAGILRKYKILHSERNNNDDSDICYLVGIC